MSAAGNDPIVWKVRLATPPVRVFIALSTARGLSQWLAPTCHLDGETFTLEHPGGERLEARIVGSVAPKRFVLDYLGGTATFELVPTEVDGTELTLSHEGFPENERADNQAGWVSALLALKAALDHGVDLRNHAPGKGWAQGYCDV